ncbi:hypothetical protein XENOCAPTIV_020207, partial [Xenoophorus captivus]
LNETFEYKCQNCVCDGSTKTVICKPKMCPVRAEKRCTGPGYVLANQTDPLDPCCTGFEYVKNNSDDCCGTCVQTHCVINVNGTKIPLKTAANGCCKICEYDFLFFRVKDAEISRHTEIFLSSHIFKGVEKEKSCRYSEAAAAMEHSCSCCKETRSSNRTVDLVCPNGGMVPFTYMYVEECS